MISRPDLINLLMTMVPLRRIHLSKRILSTTQDEHKVVITCADNTSYEGSILIGADGAYSSVRQNMYKELAKMGSLPKNDAKPLGYSFDCLVGVTSPLDPSLYPVCDEKYSEFQIILGTDVPNTVSRQVQASISTSVSIVNGILLISPSKHTS
jgi:2-polyprenyl-6-methoxyphenol hydroxylase-like FAD-dependent oxidoreductase